MKKIIIFTLILFALMFTTNAIAVDHTWQMVCLTRGENLKDYGNFVCQTHPTNQACECNGNCCRYCLNEVGDLNPNRCPLPSQGCECGESPVSDIEPPIMTVIVPAEGGVFNARAIEVKVTTDEDAAIYIKNNLVATASPYRICAFGKSCVRSTNFNEGLNDYSFYAYDWNGNMAEARRTFYVDSVKPVIRSTLPKAGGYAINTFSVIYDEMNPKEVTLYYKENGAAFDKHVPKTDCLGGLNKQCDITVASIAQGSVDYKICIIDLGGTEVCSARTVVIVDTKAPVITVTSPAIITPNPVFNSRSVPFNIGVDESVTLTYSDSTDGRIQTLCAGCTSYNLARTFLDGSHTVRITAKDPATNQAYKDTTFYVDSKAPIITKTAPLTGTFGNGEFKVDYQEENVKQVLLYYKQGINDNYQTKQGVGCPSGLTSCTITVTLLDGDVWFYFKVIDVADQEAVSSVSHITVDSKMPVLIVENPNDEVYSSRSVPFDMTVIDANPVTLEYVDNTVARPQYKLLSKGQTAYHNYRSFIDGPHEIIIRATDPAGNEVNYPWSFIVDSVAPRIIKSSPIMNGFGGNTITATYMEQNPVGLTLYYRYVGDAAFTKAPTRTNCPGGKTAECSITVALQSGKVVEYYFELTDIAGNKVTQSRSTKFTVDTIMPGLDVFSPVAGTYSSNSINFNLGSTEPVAFEYIDYKSISPRWRRLAVNVMTFNRNMALTDGAHDIEIRAIDNAGNTANSEHILFTVV